MPASSTEGGRSGTLASAASRQAPALPPAATVRAAIKALEQHGSDALAVHAAAAAAIVLAMPHLFA